MRFLILQQKNCLPWVYPEVERAAHTYGHTLVKWTPYISDSEYDGILCLLDPSYELSMLCLNDVDSIGDEDIMLGRGTFEGIFKKHPYTFVIGYNEDDSDDQFTMVSGLEAFRDDADVNANDYTAWGRISNFYSGVIRDMDDMLESLQGISYKPEHGNDEFLLLM